MSDDAGERTLAPSTKRRHEAVKHGNVLRSRELATAAATMVGALWLRFAGPWVYSALSHAARAGFTWDRASLESFDAGQVLRALLLLTLPPVLLLGAAIIIASLGSQLGFGEGRFVPANLVPKPARLNPLSGLKRMFGIGGLIEMGKGLLKVTVLGAIAIAWGWHRVQLLVGLGRAGLAGQLALAWESLTSLLFALAFGLLLIACVDLPVQWLRRMHGLRMSQQEVKDERKETDGSPEAKAKQRERQRAVAKAGIATALRKAQFVVTNPTHFTIALTYDPALATAPVVLAKGRGEKALAMRELAAEYAVPTLEYPALARALYYTTRERQMIHEELYASVAAVLAFVLSLRRGEVPARPRVDVPVTLRFDADGRLEQA